MKYGMKTDYLPYVSGLKGLGALIVFIHHFFYCFYPLFIPEGMQSAPIEHIPVANLLVNGNFAVCLFLLLSGFLMARNAARFEGTDAYGDAVVRRYLRLMIPLAVAATLSYLLCVTGSYRIHAVSDVLGNELTANYFSEVHFYHLFVSYVWAPFGYHVLVGPFWMMEYILLGSLLVMAVTLAIRRQRPLFQRLTILFAIVVAFYLQVYYACVLAGMLLFKLGERPLSLPRAARIPVVFILLAAACWLAADQENVMNYDTYKNVTAAFLFVSAILMSHSLVRFFGSRPMDALGKLSLGVFIFHWPVICSLSCWLYLAWPIRDKYLSLGLNFIVTLAVSMLLAHWYNRWVAPRAAILQKRIIDFLHR